MPFKVSRAGFGYTRMAPLKCGHVQGPSENEADSLGDYRAFLRPWKTR